MTSAGSERTNVVSGSKLFKFDKPVSTGYTAPDFCVREANLAKRGVSRDSGDDVEEAREEVAVDVDSGAVG